MESSKGAHTCKKEPISGFVKIGVVIVVPESDSKTGSSAPYTAGFAYRTKANPLWAQKAKVLPQSSVSVWLRPKERLVEGILEQTVRM